MTAQWRSFPRGTPTWLLRYPLLLADWIAAVNVLRRLRARMPQLLALVVAAVVTLAIALSAAAEHSRSTLEFLLAHRVLLGALAALHVTTTVARRRRQVLARHDRLWLSAAPSASRGESAAQLLACCGFLLLQLLAASLLIALAASITEVPGGTALWLIACLCAGLLTGIPMGWGLSRKRDRHAYEPSRYVSRRQPRDAIAPRSDALSSWPMAQVSAWSRPENLRVALVIALFAVQGGSSAIHGLSVIAMWLVTGYLGGLLAAMSTAARDAARWLRVTPLSFAQFAWAIARRTLLQQVLGTLAAATVAMQLGAPVSMALYMAALWLTVVALVSSIVLAQGYRACNPRLRIALSLLTMAAIESRAHMWSIPLAVLAVLCHLREGARS